MVICNNICQKLKILNGETNKISRYKNGKKFCRRCECYFATDRRFCECCGMTLRYNPHDKNSSMKNLIKRSV
jgi:rRNA maturation endonuclease Nob1